MSKFLEFSLISILAVGSLLAELTIPIFGGAITIRNNSDGSFTVDTQKKTLSNAEKYTSFVVRKGIVEDFEFSTNSTRPAVSNEPSTTTTTTTAAKQEEKEFMRRPSQQRPRSDVLNALLSMFGRF